MKNIVKMTKNMINSNLLNPEINDNQIIFDEYTYNKDYIYFDRPLITYRKPGEFPESSYYFIIEVEDCEYFEFYKHIEHVPKKEFVQLLETKINYNVWI